MQLTKNDWRVQYCPSSFTRTEEIRLTDEEVASVKFLVNEMAKAGIKHGVSLDDLDRDTALKLIKLQQDGCPIYTITGDNNLVQLTALGFTLVDHLVPFRVINQKCCYKGGVDYQLAANLEQVVLEFRVLSTSHNGYLELSMKPTDVASPVERAEFIALITETLARLGPDGTRVDGTTFINPDVLVKYLSRHVYPQLLKLGIKLTR